MGKFLLTCSIVILFILLQTREIVSIRGLIRPRNHRPFSPNRPSNTGNLHVNRPAYSYPPNSRNAPPLPPPPRDSSQNLLIPGNPGNLPPHSIISPNLSNLPRPSSIHKKTGNLPSYSDNFPNAPPPPPPRRDSSQNPGYPPRYPVNPKNPRSFSHQPYNHQNPQLGKYNPKPKRPKGKDMLEAANDIAEAIKDLYTLFTSSEGGNSRSHDGNPADSKPKGDEVKYVEETVRNAPVVDPESYILGSPIAKMFLRFNDSEEKWWNENRHRFPTPVYHQNSIQPISRERVALANSLGRASGHNPQNNAVSDLHFSFENALFLIHPFAISVITLITPFLIF
ncbi:uncharacterized protein [Erythrolamprus reginae]|uniref:uncharacterized protein n=1 Tax=Erythrolamprus reginae TaxID=121349 RepID=UPI00396C4AAD